MEITQVISGGQTGADRGALDAAIYTDIPHGGWCPSGRKAEDGQIPVQYQLMEMDSDDYKARTQANVTDSDLTLVFTFGEPIGGSAYTIELCRKQGKPYRAFDLERVTQEEAIIRVREWLDGTEQLDLLEPNVPLPRGKCVMNVAGNRESEAPGIYRSVKRVMIGILASDDAPARRTVVFHMPNFDLGFDD